MAPIKFEEDIKDKLDKRSLQPSAGAWNKLSEQLDNQDKKKDKKGYWWLGIAASIVGGLFVVTQYYNAEIHVDDLPKVVTNPEIIPQKETTKIAIEKVDLKEVNSIESVIRIDNNILDEKSKDKTPINRNILKESVAVIPKENSSSKEDDIEVKPAELIQENFTFENQKIQEVVAQVQALKEDNKDVTDADIDVLLLEAQKEIRLNKLINKTTGVVDANLLLQDVEDDLEQSFRNKVFKALKASYNSVKTSVAQRNN